MNKTDIDWTDYTWNPETGCLGPTGKGRCSYCYAHKLAKGRLRAAYLANKHVAPFCDESDPFSPRFWDGRLDEPYALDKPSKIFVVSMGDLFGSGVPDKWVNRILNIINDNKRHTFQLLTKCPGQLPRWSPFPDNCWVGVTATDRAMFKAATMWLQQVTAKVKYVSVEPFINVVIPFGIRHLDWLILGGLSGAGAYTHDVEHVDAVLDTADAYGVPVFIKRNLDWPVERQEWPKGVETAA
jgi:protein gp37